MGSLMNIHTVDGPVDVADDLAGADPVLKELLFHELLDRGIYLAPRGYIAMSSRSPTPTATGSWQRWPSRSPRSPTDTLTACTIS